ncbi:unnamed protein product [Chrysoparadoxa australica]
MSQAGTQCSVALADAQSVSFIARYSLETAKPAAPDQPLVPASATQLAEVGGENLSATPSSAVVEVGGVYADSISFAGRYHLPSSDVAEVGGVDADSISFAGRYHLPAGIEGGAEGDVRGPLDTGAVGQEQEAAIPEGGCVTPVQVEALARHEAPVAEITSSATGDVVLSAPCHGEVLKIEASAGESNTTGHEAQAQAHELAYQELRHRGRQQLAHLGLKTQGKQAMAVGELKHRAAQAMASQELKHKGARAVAWQELKHKAARAVASQELKHKGARAVASQELKHKGGRAVAQMELQETGRQRLELEKLKAEAAPEAAPERVVEKEGEQNIPAASTSNGERQAAALKIESMPRAKQARDFVDAKQPTSQQHDAAELEIASDEMEDIAQLRVPSRGIANEGGQCWSGVGEGQDQQVDITVAWACGLGPPPLPETCSQGSNQPRGTPELIAEQEAVGLETEAAAAEVQATGEEDQGSGSLCWDGSDGAAAISTRGPASAVGAARAQQSRGSSISSLGASQCDFTLGTGQSDGTAAATPATAALDLPGCRGTRGTAATTASTHVLPITGSCGDPSRPPLAEVPDQSWSRVSGSDVSFDALAHSAQPMGVPLNSNSRGNSTGMMQQRQRRAEAPLLACSDWVDFFAPAHTLAPDAPAEATSECATQASQESLGFTDAPGSIQSHTPGSIEPEEPSRPMWGENVAVGEEDQGSGVPRGKVKKVLRSHGMSEETKKYIAQWRKFLVRSRRFYKTELLMRKAIAKVMPLSLAKLLTRSPRSIGPDPVCTLYPQVTRVHPGVSQAEAFITLAQCRGCSGEAMARLHEGPFRQEVTLVTRLLSYSHLHQPNSSRRRSQQSSQGERGCTHHPARESSSPPSCSGCDEQSHRCTSERLLPLLTTAGRTQPPPSPFTLKELLASAEPLSGPASTLDLPKVRGIKGPGGRKTRKLRQDKAMATLSLPKGHAPSLGRSDVLIERIMEEQYVVERDKDEISLMSEATSNSLARTMQGYFVVGNQGSFGVGARARMERTGLPQP